MLVEPSFNTLASPKSVKQNGCSCHETRVHMIDLTDSSSLCTIPHVETKVSGVEHAILLTT